MNVRSKVIRKLRSASCGAFILGTTGPALVHFGSSAIWSGGFLLVAVVRKRNQRVGRPGTAVARSNKALLAAKHAFLAAAAVVHRDSAAVVHGRGGGCGATAVVHGCAARAGAAGGGHCAAAAGDCCRRWLGSVFSSAGSAGLFGCRNGISDGMANLGFGF